METRPEVARALTRRLRRELESEPLASLGRTTVVRCEVSYLPGSSPVTGSTYARELVYTVAHAIHHDALIAVMAGLMGVTLPEEFGIAPPTRAHQKSQSVL